MSKTRRTDLTNKQYCNCSCLDGNAKLSKRKDQFLRKFRTGVKKRLRQKVRKEGITIKKKVGGLPVKHYVNLPGWVVKNLKDFCKKSQRRKKTSKSPPPMRHSMESVKERKSSQRNMNKEQVPAEVMEIKREMAST